MRVPAIELTNFWFSVKIVLDLFCDQEYLYSHPAPAKEVRRFHHRRRSGMRRTRRVCGPFVRWRAVKARQLQSSERTMTRRRGGRPKDPAMRRCPAFSQGARRRGAAGSCKPIKPSRAERRRMRCVRSRCRKAACRVLFHQHTVSCAWKAHDATWSPTWRRGRGETPCRSARPFGGSRNKTTGEPRAGDGRGAMTRVWS